MTPERGLLDTSAIIAIETDRLANFGRFPLRQLVSTISLGELEYGVHAATTAEERSARMRTLTTISSLAALPVDREATGHWGRLRYRLREQGRRINVNDLWIASIALAHGLPVITQDRDFELLTDLGGPTIIYV
jgi:predicted nucleic acid-binding protein